MYGILLVRLKNLFLYISRISNIIRFWSARRDHFWNLLKWIPRLEEAFAEYSKLVWTSLWWWEFDYEIKTVFEDLSRIGRGLSGWSARCAVNAKITKIFFRSAKTVTHDYFFFMMRRLNSHPEVFEWYCRLNKMRTVVIVGLQDWFSDCSKPKRPWNILREVRSRDLWKRRLDLFNNGTFATL